MRDFCLNINVLLRGLHLLHLPTFSIDGDHATGSLHFQFDYGLTAPDTHEITAVTGLYEVDYRLTDVGWRIEHRRERVTSRDARTFFPGSYGQS